MNARPDFAQRDETPFAVIFAQVFGDQRGGPVEILGNGKSDAVLGLIEGFFRWVEAVKAA